MPRFRFSLEPALRYKERRERLAEIAQLHALGRKQACAAEVNRLRQSLEMAAQFLHGRMATGFDVTTWLATMRQTEQLGKSLQAARDREREADRQFQEAVKVYQQAAREAEALRTLKQQQHHDYLEATARAEQIDLEQIALRRWPGPERAEGEES